MGVLGEENRACGAMGRAVLADGLRDGQDMAFVEGAIEGGTTMPRGAETDGRIWREAIVGGDETGDVHEHGRSRAFASQGIEGHNLRYARCPPSRNHVSLEIKEFGTSFHAIVIL